MLSGWLDVKGDPLTKLCRDSLFFKIDFELVTHAFGLVKQTIDRFGVEYDRKQAVLEAVVIKDIRETRGDQHPKPIILKSPGRVFTRGSAAEVFPRQENPGPIGGRFVEDEVGIEWTLGAVHVGFAAVEIAPLVKEVNAEAAALDGLQELLWNDGISVDVGPVERNDSGVNIAKGFHDVVVLLRGVVGALVVAVGLTLAGFWGASFTGVFTAAFDVVGVGLGVAAGAFLACGAGLGGADAFVAKGLGAPAGRVFSVLTSMK